MVNYLNSVIEFNNSSNDLNVIKSYEGKMDQDLVKKFTEEIEHLFESNGSEFKTSKKVFHVVVEMLQNVCKHSEGKKEKIKNVGEGVFILASDKENFYIRVGNIAKKNDAKVVVNNLDKFNPLDPDSLKIKYRELIKASRISEKGGAGLGLIDIIKKTKHRIDYQSNEIDNNYTFFIQQATVNFN